MAIILSVGQLATKSGSVGSDTVPWNSSTSQSKEAVEEEQKMKEAEEEWCQKRTLKVAIGCFSCQSFGSGTKGEISTPFHTAIWFAVLFVQVHILAHTIALFSIFQRRPVLREKLAIYLISTTSLITVAEP